MAGRTSGPAGPDGESPVSPQPRGFFAVAPGLRTSAHGIMWVIGVKSLGAVEAGDKIVVDRRS